MQFLVLTRRRTESFSENDFDRHLEAEREKARALYIESFLRQIRHRGDTAGACLLVEAESEVQVHHRLSELPLVAAGTLEVSSVTPLKPYAGFGPRG